jgi:NitT/TauT family transport system permease protein
LIAAALGAVIGLVEYIRFLNGLTMADWRDLFRSTVVTFLRVVAAVGLATLWTVPIGVLIGRHPKWARRLQPVIQMVASFPAPMIFPLVVSVMIVLGGTLGFGSIILLMLSTQWYILFNVIAGSNKIPAELWELASLSRFSRSIRWCKLILPGLFPYLVTGWITAMGGAWNASIVAEYVQHKGHLLTTVGLGALISQATEQGQFHLLAAAIAMMALVVVGLNRLVWHPLGNLAQARYGFE